jgi:hypothetical protein
MKGRLNDEWWMHGCESLADCLLHVPTDLLLNPPILLEDNLVEV